MDSPLRAQHGFLITTSGHHMNLKINVADLSNIPLTQQTKEIEHGI